MSSIVSYIEAAKRASGKSKQVVLVDAPEAVQEVFKYTYDDQKYGVVNIYQQTPGTAHLEDVPFYREYKAHDPRGDSTRGLRHALYSIISQG